MQPSPTLSPIDQQPTSAPERPKKRVRFAPGPLQGLHDSEDGHPGHEGETAQAVRLLDHSYVAKLSKPNVKAIEELLEGSCPESVERLKRRVGLLPLVKKGRRPYAGKRKAEL